MGGPRITLIRPLILSDPLPGMSRGGRPGINSILNTGRILNKSIPITVGTMLVRLMTRIFIIPTIVARGKAGIRDTMASVRLGTAQGVSPRGAAGLTSRVSVLVDPLRSSRASALVEPPPTSRVSVLVEPLLYQQGVSPRGTAPVQQGVSPRGTTPDQQGVSPRGTAPVQQGVSPRGTTPGTSRAVSPRGATGQQASVPGPLGPAGRQSSWTRSWSSRASVLVEPVLPLAAMPLEPLLQPGVRRGKLLLLRKAKHQE